MKNAQRVVSWVVYQMALRGKPGTVNAVCEQAEWDAMEQAAPGHHTLLRAGIATEGEAERLARAESAAAGGKMTR